MPLCSLITDRCQRRRQEARRGAATCRRWKCGMVLSAALSAYIRAPTTQGKLREVAEGLAPPALCFVLCALCCVLCALCFVLRHLAMCMMLREVRPVSERNSHLYGACGITPPCRDRVHFSGKTVLGLPPSRPSSQKIGETCTDGVEIGANLPGNQTICT